MILLNKRRPVENVDQSIGNTTSESPSSSLLRSTFGGRLMNRWGSDITTGMGSATYADGLHSASAGDVLIKQSQETRNLDSVVSL